MPPKKTQNNTPQRPLQPKPAIPERNTLFPSVQSITHELLNMYQFVLRTIKSPHFNFQTALSSGGLKGVGILLSKVKDLGIFFGSGAPTLSASKGSIYIRSDSDTLYVNADGSTSWKESLNEDYTTDSITFTNKTIDSADNTIVLDTDDSGLTLTDVNGEELEPVDSLLAGQFAIPIIFVATKSADETTTSIFSSNFPFKAVLIDAWVVQTDSGTGTWKIDNGTSDITSTVSFSADQAITRADSIDDNTHLIQANGSLRLITQTTTEHCLVYIQVIRLT